MGAGDVAGRADVADDLAAADVVADGRGERGLVAVPELGAVLEGDDGLVAVGAVVADRGDDAVGDGRGSGCRCGRRSRDRCGSSPRGRWTGRSGRSGGSRTAAGPTVERDLGGLLLRGLGELGERGVALLGLRLGGGLELLGRRRPGGRRGGSRGRRPGGVLGGRGRRAGLVPESALAATMLLPVSVMTPVSLMLTAPVAEIVSAATPSSTGAEGTPEERPTGSGVLDRPALADRGAGRGGGRGLGGCGPSRGSRDVGGAASWGPVVGHEKKILVVRRRWKRATDTNGPGQCLEIATVSIVDKNMRSTLRIGRDQWWRPHESDETVRTSAVPRPGGSACPDRRRWCAP